MINKIGCIAKTKSGNRYKKSTIGTKAGTITGAALGGISYLKKGIEIIAVDSKTGNPVKSPLLTVINILANLGIFTFAGALIGKGIDTIANKIMGNKADKEAQKTFQTKI